jgi:hypothetical protein
MVASMKITVFMDVAPCSLVEVYRCFRGACCFQNYGGRLHGAASQKTVIFEIFYYFPQSLQAYARIVPWIKLALAASFQVFAYSPLGSLSLFLLFDLCSQNSVMKHFKSPTYTDIFMFVFQVNGSMKSSWVLKVSCKLGGPPVFVNSHRKLVLVSYDILTDFFQGWDWQGM